ncbi:MAG: hypothetical protein J4478_02255 [Candidatus Diapherotrites archaeon]|uniref:Uncharacterized protein n=1 Tax=Candidatus Iainarchaeum sp. TaxID=3101447 RepID=A0A8T4KUV3_9ARCH|nr:hypothetical protein [Candidatus Diapherotrites archaeon]
MMLRDAFKNKLFTLVFAALVLFAIVFYFNNLIIEKMALAFPTQNDALLFTLGFSIIVTPLWLWGVSSSFKKLLDQKEISRELALTLLFFLISIFYGISEEKFRLVLESIFYGFMIFLLFLAAYLFTEKRKRIKPRELKLLPNIANLLFYVIVLPANIFHYAFWFFYGKTNALGIFKVTVAVNLLTVFLLAIALAAFLYENHKA